MSKRERIVINVILAALTLLGIAICMMPGVGSGPPALRTQCRNNLHVLGLALHTYHDANASFPPAYIADGRGAPIQSWRVLALPYVDQAPLYNRYDFSKPWDDPANWDLAGHVVPPVYQCPSEVKARDTRQPRTSYVAIVGPHTVWPGAEPTTISDITDGTGNTLLVVESHNTGIHWMEPRDLYVGQMSPAINSLVGQGMSSLHEGGSFALFADGSARFLSDSIDPSVLRRLRERDDGEEVPGF